MKKTMIDVASAYIKKNGAAEFTKIWKFVFSELKTQWKEDDPKSLLKAIEETKMSELHTLLTISGKFERLLNNKYELSEKLTFQQIKVLRENVKPQQDQTQEVV